MTGKLINKPPSHYGMDGFMVGNELSQPHYSNLLITFCQYLSYLKEELNTLILDNESTFEKYSFKLSLAGGY